MSEEINPLVRIAEALESIAGSLERIAYPQIPCVPNTIGAPETDFKP